MKKLLVTALLLIFSVNVYASGLDMMADAKYRPEKLALKASAYAIDGELTKAEELYKWLIVFHEDDYFYEKLTGVYLKEEKIEEAEALLKKGLLRNPQSIGMNYLLGTLYAVELQNHAEAEKYLAKAVKLAEKENNTDEKYYVALAELYSLNKKYTEAAEVYGKLLKFKQDPFFYLQRAKIYEKLEDEDNYILNLEKANELENTPSAVARLADYYAKKKQFDKALKYYEMLIEEMPDNIQLHVRIAELYRVLGKFDKAIEHLDGLASKLNGEQKLYVLKQISTAFYQKGDYDNSLIFLDKIVQEFPKDTASYYSMGIIYELKNEFDKAISVYKTLLSIRPDYYEASKRLAYLYFKKKDDYAALKVFNEIDEKDRDAQYYRIGHLIHSALGNKDKSLEYLEQGYKENKTNIDIIIDLASVYVDKKDNDSAVDLLKKGLEFEPNNHRLLNFLGYLYADMNTKLDEAYAMISNALNQKPESGAYQDSMAWVLYRMGKFDEALTHQKKAIKQHPSEKEIVDHLKSILKALGSKKSVKDIINED